MPKTAFLAPGQGIDSWNDGPALFEASSQTERIYDEVYEATGVDILEVCRSNEPINDSSIVQPAALGIGIARAEMFKEAGVRPDYLIGLSSGEFTVAAISGALTVRDAARISHQRGVFQNEVGGGKGGAVVAVHKRSLNIQEVLRDIDGVNVANFNTPLKTAFAYTHEAYEQLVERLYAMGASKVIKIPNLNFPPHGPIVEEVERRLAKLFEKGVEVKDAAVPIISTRTAKATKKAHTVKHNLIWQTSRPTRLKYGINNAIRLGVKDFYDLGPGRVMTRMLGDFALAGNVRINPIE